MKQTLMTKVKEAKDNLDIANKALFDFEAKAENNVFATMREAELKIHRKLEAEAHNDCEGAGNCGAESYQQEFMVDGVVYVGTLTVEYNRHDKTYYYIDRSDFTVAVK